MTPVYLVSLAYKISLSDLGSTNGQRLKAALALSEAGLAMVQGQSLDILPLDDIDPIQGTLMCYHLKSGTLYAMAAKAGAVICGAGPGQADSLYECGLKLELSYQLLDDVADAMAEVQEVGKNVKMDMNKKTALKLIGLEEVKEKADRYKQDALLAISHFGSEADLLRALIRQPVGHSPNGYLLRAIFNLWHMPVPAPVYCSRRPQQSSGYHCFEENLETMEQVYEDHFERTCGSFH